MKRLLLSGLLLCSAIVWTPGSGVQALSAADHTILPTQSGNILLFGDTPAPEGTHWLLQELNGRDVTPLLSDAIVRPGLAIIQVNDDSAVIQIHGFDASAMTVMYSRPADSPDGLIVEYHGLSSLCADRNAVKLDWEWQKTLLSPLWRVHNGSLELLEHGVVRARLILALPIQRQPEDRCSGLP